MGKILPLAPAIHQKQFIFRAKRLPYTAFSISAPGRFLPVVVEPEEERLP